MRIVFTPDVPETQNNSKSLSAAATASLALAVQLAANNNLNPGKAKNSARGSSRRSSFSKEDEAIFSPTYKIPADVDHQDHAHTSESASKMASAISMTPYNMESDSMEISSDIYSASSVNLFHSQQVIKYFVILFIYLRYKSMSRDKN